MTKVNSRPALSLLFLLSVACTPIETNTGPQNGPPPGGGVTSTGWRPAKAVGTPRAAANFEIFPSKVVLNAQKVGFAIWAEGDNVAETQKVWVARFKDNNWGNPTDLGSDHSLDPQIGITNDGQAVAVWMQRTLNSSGMITG